MAESKELSEDSDSFLKEDFAHVEELLISSREECIDISSKYQDLNKQVQELIKFQKENESDESITSEQSETHKEFRYSMEEQLSKYENQIAAYQHTQTRQAEIIDDLHIRFEEYRKKCAKLEAALAEQKVQEAAIEESESSQNVFSMDLETALIKLEQVKNRCHGLTEINKLLREQLETATEVNQTLTSDFHCLTKEWQNAKSELLAKESEWKEEEQTISMYLTKESNILLSFWRQILNFKHDFLNLKSSTEKDLESFKICICQNIQNIKNVHNNSTFETEESLSNFESLTEEKKSNNDFVAEKEKLHERINDLIDRNERIQWLLDEKEKVNTTLYKTIEKINTSFKSTTHKTETVKRTVNTEKVYKEYISVVKSLSDVLVDDPKSEVSSNFVLHSFSDANIDKLESITDENIAHFQTIISSVKNTLKKYSKQIDEANINLSSLKEQNSMQQRTIEFLEGEREKMQEMNTKLSMQFDSLHLKVQDLLKEGSKPESLSDDNRSSYLDVMVKSLNDKIESLNAENCRLYTAQEELQSKIKDLHEEKRLLISSEQNLKLDANKNLKKISVLEKNMDSLRKDYLQTQELLQQTTLDKELFEEEKQKFSTLLSNLEKQCFDLKNCLQQLKEEENVVKESLVSVQNLSENLSMEKKDLSQLLNETTAEIEKVKEDQSIEKIRFEKERGEMKSKIDSLKGKCSELENENERLKQSLQSIESVKSNIEEEKSQINIYNTDLTNQVTKYSTQKKNIETELEKVREELKQELELSKKLSSENNSLLKSKTELSMKLETLENEMTELNDVILVLKEEKANLEKSLFDAQKAKVAVQEEKADLARELDLQTSSASNLQDQVKELQELYKKYVDDSTKEKNSLMMKMQEIEQEFQVTLKNEQQQHSVEIQILSEEKESLRTRLVSSVDEIFETNQKEQETLISAHQEELAELKKQISSLEIECNEKDLLLQTEKKKIDNESKEKIISLESIIEKLKLELSEYESTVTTLEESINQLKSDKGKVVQEHAQIQRKFKEEIDSLSLENSTAIKELQNQLKDLKELKEMADENVNKLQIQMKDIEDEKNKLLKEMNESNSNIKNEKNSKSHLEDQIALLQNQLSDEKNLNELISRSFDDCKQRLKSIQAENIELNAQIEETKQQLNVFENSNALKLSQHVELKNTLRDCEKARFDLKREVSSLRKKITILEGSLKVREQEVAELVALRDRDEDKEDELKREIVSLRQKLLESAASNDAMTKEMMSSRQKLSNLEHKLKIQLEQHHSSLQESLTNEQTLSEYRIDLERSLTEATKEIQRLRSSLNFEEGKVLALESRVVKLDGTKRDVENKLYSVCLFLRSTLGLGSDSGFLSISNAPFSPMQSQKSNKSLDSSRSFRGESPQRLNTSRNSSHAQLHVTDHDIDLLKTALVEMVEKYSTTEKERDDLKDSVTRLQKQEEEIRNEHSRCLAKIYQLKRDLEDKRNVEKDLATKIASIHHHEEVIRTLEREKRRLNEKVGNLDFNLSAVTKEKEIMLEKMEEMKSNVTKLEQELKTVLTVKEQTETKAIKYFQSYQYIENNVSSLKETVETKDKEIRSLDHNLQTANKKFLASEKRNKNLQETIEKLNSAIEKHIENEQLLQQKINSLNSTLSLNSETKQNFYQELESIGKERRKYQNEITYLQQSLVKSKNSADEYELKNKILHDEIEDLRRNFNRNQENEEEKIRNLQNLLMKTKELESDSTQQINHLQNQKSSLEKRITEMSNSLRECKENLLIKEETCLLLEKEKKSLHKALEKIEKEKQKSSEETAKYLLDKSSLGRSLTKMEIENAALQERVQNLQAKLAELEERHSQRLKDFLHSQSIESNFEDQRLRTTLKQTEQLMEAREKIHRQRVLGLEEQISVLKNHLEREKLRWQQYHQRSVSANANINYLHSVISKSLQNVSEDPQKFLPEAERLDLTTEVELSTSPNISISTPSKLSQSASRTNKTSTPKAKRNLDFSPKS